MAKKPLPWFRYYHEAATDTKFDVISMTTGIDWCTVFGAWTKILCIAASSPIRGSLYVTLLKRFSNDNVTAMLKFTPEKTMAIMKAFMECDMIDLDEDGAYRVMNWGKRQYASDSSTERVRKLRKNRNETLQKRDSNDDVTTTYVSVSDSSSNSVLSIIPDENEEESEIRKLSKTFEQAAGILAYDLAKWETACSDMFFAGVTPDLLHETICDMRNPKDGGKELTVAGPWSCKNIAIARAGKLRSNPAQSQMVDVGGSF
jgi:hypothetical protein